MKIPELLAPAGGMRQLRAAVRFGADAVYVGMKQYGLRAFAGNFDDEELAQAVRIALPPLTNQAVNLIKNSSVLSVVTARDLIYSLDSIAARSDNYGPPLLMTGLLYLCICLPISLLARRLEGRLVRHG